jgi:hypothetical protein
MQHERGAAAWGRPVLMLAIAGAAGFTLALIADSGEAAYSKRVQAACKGDYKRLCPNYKTGSLQLRACMEAKADQISSGCIDALIDSGEAYRRVKR